MIPIKDELPTRQFPAVTVTIIAINVLVFLYSLTLGPAREEFLYQTGLIPAFFWGREEIPSGYFTPMLTLFSSMFQHGSILHIFFNMLYLWIFGNNVEDYLGRFHFVLFYLGSGIAAAMLHSILFPASMIPTIGASGAVAGAMGGYFILFPRARVVVLFILGFFIYPARVPAVLVLGFWILIQLIYGVFALALGDVGGVAWFAHLGGFIAGLAWCRAASVFREESTYW